MTRVATVRSKRGRANTESEKKRVFREANAIARQFTWPVVTSVKPLVGICSASIGACVVINDEGWIVTADHIVDQLQQLMAASAQVRDIEAQRAAIENDTALSGSQRKKQLNKIPRPRHDAPDKVSIWFGGRDQSKGPIQVAGNLFHRISPIDVAVARLEPFDPAWVRTYPIFKDPTKDYDSGKSLCKLGFPLSQITPTWNAQTGQFELPHVSPPGSPPLSPLTFFPIDGILTRFANVVVSNAPAPPFPLVWIETSSPGLRGQSGGPMFDDKGTVWGIQVQTHSYALGFKTGASDQFLNVGLGVHAQTLIDFFNSQGIKFALSSY